MGAALGMLLLCALAASAILQSSWSRRSISAQLSGLVPPELGWTMEVSEPEGGIPFSMRLPLVRISDKDGPWLEARDISLSIGLWPRAQGLADAALTVGQTHVLRQPHLPAPQAPGPAVPSHPLAFLDALTPLPVGGGVSVTLERIVVAPELAGRLIEADARLTAAASGNAVRAALECAVRGDAPARLTLEASCDPAGRAASVRLQADEAPGGLAGNLLGLPAQAPVSASFTGNGPLADWKAALEARTGEATLCSAALNARLGRSQREDARLALTAALYPAHLPSLPEALRRAAGERVECTLDGLLTSAGLPEPQWNLLVQQADVAMGAATFSARGETGPGAAKPSLSFTLAVSDPGAFGLKTGPVALEGKAGADVDPKGPLRAHLRLAAPDVGRALAPMRVEIAGKALLEAELAGDSAAQDFALRAALTLADLAAGGGAQDAKLLEALGEKPTLALTARLEKGAKAILEHLRLETRSASAQASGSYSLAGGDVDATFALDAGNLALLGPLAGLQLGGAARVTASAAGAQNQPALRLEAQVKNLRVDTTVLDSVSVNLAAKPDADGLEGSFEARAARAANALTASTALRYGAQRLALSRLQAAGPGVQVSGDLTASLEHGTAEGSLRLSVELARLGAFLQRKMEGTGKADVSLKASGPRQDATLRLSAAKIAAEGAAIGALEATGDVRDALRAPQGSLAATVSGLAASGKTVETLTVAAKGTGKSVGFSVAAKGTLPEHFDLALAGNFAPAPAGGTLTLETLQANAYSSRLALTRPAKVVLAQGGFALDTLALTLDSASITASGTLNASRADVKAQVAALPLPLLKKFGQPPMTGTLSATVETKGHPASPEVTASLDILKLRATDFMPASQPPVEAHLRATAASGRASASGGISAGPGTAFDITAALPLKLRLKPFELDVSRTAQLEASLTGGADLASAARMAGNEGLRAKGRLQAGFSVSGSIGAPVVSGKASIAGGEVLYASTGTLLKDIALDMEATGDSITIRQFSARDSLGMPLTLSGQADLAPGRQLPFQATLAMDRFSPVRSDQATSSLTGDITLTGNASGAQVKGAFTVGPTEVNLPAGVPPEATPIEVQMGRQPPGAPKAPPAPPAYPVALDLAIHAPGRVFVRGMGLDSVWAGDVYVKGTAAQPVVEGGLRIVRGQMDFFGKIFKLVRGDVHFYGGSPPAPVMDVEAHAPAGDATAVLTLSGPAMAPALQISSTPEMPRDEVLARVLFGKGVAGLTPPQALQLASAVASMAGIGGGLDVLGKTRRMAGLDYLGYKSSEGSAQGSVAAGKYLADGVYVEASQEIGGKAPAVSVQIDVTKNITVESKVGVDTKTEVEVNWKYDY